MNDSLASRAVLDDARLVNIVVVAEVLLALAIVATRLTAGDKFTIPGTVTSLQTKYAWIVIAAFSVGHIYVTILFRRACGRLFFTEHQNAKPSWEELTSVGPFFFRQLRPRHVPSGGFVAWMDRKDLTSWLAYGSGILLFCSMFPFKHPTIVEATASIILTWLNWTLGTHWVLAASELTLEIGQTRFLQRPFKTNRA